MLHIWHASGICNLFENNIGDLEKISKKCQDTTACYLRIFIILYADDTVILSESAEGLQEAL
jgi:hypothetical protein